MKADISCQEINSQLNSVNFRWSDARSNKLKIKLQGEHILWFSILEIIAINQQKSFGIQGESISE